MPTSNRFLNICAALGLIALIVYVLIIGRNFLLPLAVAIAIWYLILSLKDSFQRLSRYGIHLPYGTAMVLAVLTAVFAIWLIVILINSSVAGVIDAAPRYEDRFRQLIDQGTQLLGLTDKNPFDSALERIDFRSILSSIATGITGLAGDLGLIVVYVLFLLLEYRTFARKLDAIAKDETRRSNLRRIFHEIGEDVNTYMRIKTWLSAFVAALAYIVMKVVGVDFAEFWAVLIFLFNYIPTIGAVLGALFPALLMVVQFTSVPLIVTVTAILITVPVVVNNFVEPRLMGRSLNLSSLVIILSLVLWGSIWGIIGMFLCVPIMVILVIVLAKFPQTRPVAVMLSANGRID
jgi:AI-2 transport protein TqsA